MIPAKAKAITGVSDQHTGFEKVRCKILFALLQRCAGCHHRRTRVDQEPSPRKVFSYGMRRLLLDVELTQLSDPQHLHHFVAQVVDDLHCDSA